MTVNDLPDIHLNIAVWILSLLQYFHNCIWFKNECSSLNIETHSTNSLWVKTIDKGNKVCVRWESKVGLNKKKAVIKHIDVNSFDKFWKILLRVKVVVIPLCVESLVNIQKILVDLYFMFKINLCKKNKEENRNLFIFGLATK